MKNSTISGGYKNIANGDYSFAFGKEATTNIAKTAVFNWQGIGTMFIGTNAISTTDRLHVSGSTKITSNLNVGGDAKIYGKATINDVLHLTPRAEPGSPEVGDIYYNVTDEKIYVYTETDEWKALAFE